MSREKKKPTQHCGGFSAILFSGFGQTKSPPLSALLSLFRQGTTRHGWGKGKSNLLTLSPSGDTIPPFKWQ